jgi:hypothetical protein
MSKAAQGRRRIRKQPDYIKHVNPRKTLCSRIVQHSRAMPIDPEQSIRSPDFGLPLAQSARLGTVRIAPRIVAVPQTTGFLSARGAANLAIWTARRAMPRKTIVWPKGRHFGSAARSHGRWDVAPQARREFSARSSPRAHRRDPAHRMRGRFERSERSPSGPAGRKQDVGDHGLYVFRTA